MNAAVCRILSWQYACLLLAGLLAVGCTSHPRKQIPDGWQVQVEATAAQVSLEQTSATHPAVNHKIADDAAVNHATDQASTTSIKPTPQTNAVDHPQARMQVFICYGWMTSNHACMRLEGPGKQSLYWDPGGGYGQNDPNIPTKHDLLLDDDALTVEQLWDYRANGCNEPAMLMFEWNLTQEQARTRRHILIHGQTKNDPQGSFDSDAPGGFCSMAVSSYLRRFSSDNISLGRRWFWPHNLAKQLWRNKPDRVLLFERNKPAVVYVASEKTVAADTTMGRSASTTDDAGLGE